MIDSHGSAEHSDANVAMQNTNQRAIMKMKRRRKSMRQSTVRHSTMKHYSAVCDDKTIEKLSDPLKEYRAHVEQVRQNNSSHGEEQVHIPFTLIDLAVIRINSLSPKSSKSSQSFHSPQPSLNMNASIAAASSEPILVRQLLERSHLSCSTFITALYYILVTCHGHTLITDSHGSHLLPTIIAALITADKYLSDNTYETKDWVEFLDDRYTATEINEFERQFLSACDYKLHFTDDEFDSFLKYLDTLLFMTQVHALGIQRWVSLSYADLLKLGTTASLAPEYLLRLGVALSPFKMALVAVQVIARFMGFYLAGLIVASMSLYAIRDPAMLSELVKSVQIHGYHHGDIAGVIHYPTLKTTLLHEVKPSMHVKTIPIQNDEICLQHISSPLFTSQSAHTTFPCYPSLHTDKLSQTVNISWLLNNYWRKGRNMGLVKELPHLSNAMFIPPNLATRACWSVECVG